MHNVCPVTECARRMRFPKLPLESPSAWQMPENPPAAYRHEERRPLTAPWHLASTIGRLSLALNMVEVIPINQSGQLATRASGLLGAPTSILYRGNAAISAVYQVLASNKPTYVATQTPRGDEPPIEGLSGSSKTLRERRSRFGQELDWWAGFPLDAQGQTRHQSQYNSGDFDQVEMLFQNEARQ